MGKKCICLARVSTWGQDVEQQTQVIKNEAIKDGYDDKDIIIIEDHESAIKLSEEERQGLNKMKAAIQNDSSIDCVYVYEISRISRQTKIVFSIRDWLIERSIQLIILKPYVKVLNPDGTLSETSIIFFSIFAGMAENEMYIKKSRMSRGREKAKAMGRHAGGQMPFGYTTDKNHIFHVDEAQAKVIKWIFESYVGGMSMRRIAKELIDQGVFKSTFLTTVQNVNNIIHRDWYCGRKLGRPQIISVELYEKAQEICRRQVLYSNKIENQRICKGLLFDKNNGFRLSINTHSNVYYSKRAKGIAISFKVIEPLIWKFAVKKYLQQYEINTQERAKYLLDNIITLNKKIRNSDVLIDEKKEQLDRLEERIILGKVNTKLAETLEEKINNELQEIENNKIKWIEEERQNQEEYRNIINKQNVVRLSDGTVFVEPIFDKKDFDEDNMDLDSKIRLVNSVIEKVIIDRPRRYIANIEIYNKVDNIITNIQYDTFRYKILEGKI